MKDGLLGGHRGSIGVEQCVLYIGERLPPTSVSLFLFVCFPVPHWVFL